MLLLALSFASCSYVFEIDLPELKPKIVLNSFICPDESVDIHFSWSRSATDNEDSEVAIYGEVTLFENDIEVGSEQIENGDKGSSVNFDFLPKQGCTYRVVATIDSYGEVSAETYIPMSSKVSAEVVKQEKLYNQSIMQTAGIQFKVSDIQLRDDMRSLWFYTLGRMKSTETQEESIQSTNYRILFCDNPYIDDVNRAMEADLTGEIPYLNYRTGDPMYYSDLRLPQDDIEKCSSFKIASEYVYENRESINYDDYVIVDYMTHVRLVTISPSDEFDRYQKSAYQQSEGTYYFDITPLSFDEVRVYTNVKNGLGIFAGYSQTIIDMSVKNLSEGGVEDEK